MENWFKDVGRPALFEALTAACDQVGDDFDNNIIELTRDNVRLQAELEPLKTKVANVERLQDENRLLREEIQSLKAANGKSTSKKDPSTTRENTTPNPRRSTRTPLAPRYTNEPTPFKKVSKYERSDIDKLKLPELREEYSRLEGNFDKLHEKYLEALNARAELDHLLREKIKNIDQWTTHADKLRAQSQKRLEKVKRLEAQLASIGGITAGLAASFSSDTSDTSDNVPTTTVPKLHISHPEAAANIARGGQTGIKSVPDVRDFDHAPVKTRAEQVPSMGRQDSGESTQVSTQGNSHEEEAPSLPPLPVRRDGLQKVVTIKQEPSSDTPIVVSERCVRKRRREDDDIEHPQVRVRVKTEEGSDPMVYEERRNLVPQDSMDFDAEIPHVQTPRKNRLRQLQGDGSMDTPEPPRLQYSSTRSRLRNDQQALFPRPRTTIPPEPQPVEDTRPATGRGNQQIATNTTSLLPTDSTSTLRSLGSNVVPRRTSRTSKARSADPPLFQHGIASLEDDDQYQASRASRSLSGGPRPKKIISDRLNTPSVERGTGASLAILRSEEDMPTSEPRLASSEFYFQIPSKAPLRKTSEGILRRPKSPTALLPPLKRTTTAQPKRKSAGGNSDDKTMSPPPVPTRTFNRGNANTGTSTAKDRTPLRDRALSQLRLEDFRINPATNDGYTYAFTDVVRNQTERQTALVGCVRESCCGPQFRALARAERPTTGPVSFRALLESYLGDDAARRQLPGMSREAQEALWLEAKTRELADAHGRCRHRYQRMASPPGFWRTDFPSTQEKEEDRVKGQMMEAEMIQERYREAVRGGGRWLFRDEVGERQ